MVTASECCYMGSGFKLFMSISSCWIKPNGFYTSTAWFKWPPMSLGDVFLNWITWMIIRSYATVKVKQSWPGNYLTKYDSPTLTAQKITLLTRLNLKNREKPQVLRQIQTVANWDSSWCFRSAICWVRYTKRTPWFLGAMGLKVWSFPGIFNTQQPSTNPS